MNARLPPRFVASAIEEEIDGQAALYARAGRLLPGSEKAFEARRFAEIAFMEGRDVGAVALNEALDVFAAVVACLRAPVVGAIVQPCKLLAELGHVGGGDVDEEDEGVNCLGMLEATCMGRVDLRAAFLLWSEAAARDGAYAFSLRRAFVPDAVGRDTAAHRLTYVPLWRARAVTAALALFVLDLVATLPVSTDNDAELVSLGSAASCCHDHSGGTWPMSAVLLRWLCAVHRVSPARPPVCDWAHVVTQRQFGALCDAVRASAVPTMRAQDALRSEEFIAEACKAEVLDAIRTILPVSKEEEGDEVKEGEERATTPRLRYAIRAVTLELSGRADELQSPAHVRVVLGSYLDDACTRQRTARDLLFAARVCYAWHAALLL
jgi:hypothetical protein